MMQPKFAICGLEHTGTTLVSELFRQVPRVDSGFECGVFLGENPAAFKGLEPFYQNMCDGWGISVEELEECCSAPPKIPFLALPRASPITSDCAVCNPIQVNL